MIEWSLFQGEEGGSGFTQKILYVSFSLTEGFRVEQVDILSGGDGVWRGDGPYPANVDFG